MIICFQETKLEDVEHSEIRSIGGNQLVGFAVLMVIGSGGGILVLWNKNSFHLVLLLILWRILYHLLFAIG